jgi:hypothetical protein
VLVYNYLVTAPADTLLLNVVVALSKGFRARLVK